ncbi:MAG: AMP-binding protein [Candidatus Methylacidiphilales bacterium]|nr:AMP-binding protein [Candidatus Methylacidiphilales bacterium]
MSHDAASIPEVIRAQVTATPDQIAIIESPHGTEIKVTFRELDELSVRFAQHMLQQGIRPGDSVLVFVPMSVSLYACLLGIFRIGVTALFLDPSARLRHLSDCCALRPPKAFLGTWKAHLLRLASPALRSIPHHFWISANPKRLPQGNGSAVPIEHLTPPAPDDPALITFTSGSTGKPKAVVRTHRFLIAQHQALEEAIELRPGQRDLVTLPVFVLANLASGVTSILPDSDMSRPGHVDPVRIASQVKRYQPDRTCGSPAFYSRLAGSEGRAEIFATFRRIYTGGAPVFPSLLEQLQSLTQSAHIVAVYGSTEAEPIAHIRWSEVSPSDLGNMRAGKGLLTGVPVPQVRLKILRALPSGVHTPNQPVSLSATEFAQQEATTGETGEICVSGDHVLKGYLNGVGDSDTKCRVEDVIWHRTGDAGYLDDQGRVWLLGRSSAMVTDSRGILYPFAVECVAQTYPFIARSAFVSQNGKRVLVVEYKGKPATDNADVLRKSLAWAQIDEIKSVAAIPVDKRHNAKVDYPSLHKLLQAGK